MKGILLNIIEFYQIAISPLTSPSCRYLPTCSQYGYEAITKYGVLKGVWMTTKRIARCHPLAKGGIDTLP